MLQVNFQPLPKLSMITQLQPSAINPSTSPCRNQFVVINHLQVVLKNKKFDIHAQHTANEEDLSQQCKKRFSLPSSYVVVVVTTQYPPDPWSMS